MGAASSAGSEWAVSGAAVHRARLRAGLPLAVVGPRCGRSESWLCRVEHGQVRSTSLTVLGRLSAILNVAATDLLEGDVATDVVDLVSPVPADDGLNLPWTGAGSLAVLRVLTNGDDMDRRNFLSLTGAAATAPAIAWAGAPEVGDVAHAAGPRLHEGVVEDVDQMTRALNSMADRVGVAALPWARDHLKHVQGMLTGRSYDERTGMGLRRSAASLLKLCGYLSFDANDHGRAQRYWHTALRVSHAAGDRANAAGTILMMTAQAIEAGRSQEAMSLAGSARDGYRGDSPKLRSLLAFQDARARAMSHDRTGTRRSVESGFAEFSSTGTDPWWVDCWVNPGTPHRRAASAYALLGDWGQAAGHLMRAEREAPDRPGRRRSVQQIRLATTFARQENPDIDRAVATGNQALDALAGPAECPRALGFASVLVGHLEPYRRQPAVREFAGRVRALSAAV